MAKVSTNLGKVATTPKGEYSNETIYVRLDIVTYNGSSYVCLKESVGNLPTNTEYWQLIASKGDTGAKGQDGQDGHTPVKGVDYFTQEDIASLNIPSKTSDITNDSGFITKTVNDLVNYYLKSEVYTKEEVAQLIGSIQQFHYEVVQELPQTGANNIMYLVPKSTSQTNNVYDEYVYSNGWEKIGDTEIDLSNYVTITMLNQALADYTTTANLTTLLNAKQDEITNSNKLDADLVDDTNSSNKFVTSSEKRVWNNKSDFSGDYTDLTNKPTIPDELSDLIDDSTHRLVTDTEKTTWNGKQDLLTAGDNITITNNVISATGGDCNLLRYDFSNASFIPTFSSSQTKTDQATINPYRTMANDIYQLYLKGKFPLIYIRYGFTSVEDNENNNVLFMVGSISDTNMTLRALNTVGKSYYEKKPTIDMSYRVSDNLLYLITSIRFNNTGVIYLKANNEKSYNVNTNYNPAHKQYVDNKPKTYTGYDATKTQVLKNINGTLTWVDET